MKTPSLVTSILSSVKQLLQRLWWRPEKVETLYPKCLDDLVEILAQARDNKTQVKVVGGTFPVSTVRGDILVDLTYMDRLLGLDIHQQTVIAEPGMRLAALTSLLETVGLSLDLTGGRLPDLAVVDALAIGLLGAGSGICDSLLSVEVVTAQAELSSWSWSSHPSQMAALCSGLGLVAVVIAVTFKCVPLFRVTEVAYLSSIREILESWSLVHRASQSQRMIWFPFSELVVLTHTSILDRNTWAVKQSWLKEKFTNLSLSLAHLMRTVNIVLFPGLPLFSSMLARMQFISLWTAAKYRSDYAHPAQAFTHCDSLRGATWLLPLTSLPPLLYSISVWSAGHAGVVASPLYIQTRAAVSSSSRPDQQVRSGSFSTRHHQQQPRNPFLQPILQDNSCPAATLWYDWFLPETSPDPLVVAEFEDLFHSAGGVRLWSGERTVSPLVLANYFPRYKKWCQVKKELDPDLLLASGYVLGTVYTPPPPPTSSSSRQSSAAASRPGTAASREQSL